MEFKLISIASLIAFYGCYYVKCFIRNEKEYRQTKLERTKPVLQNSWKSQ